MVIFDKNYVPTQDEKLIVNAIDVDFEEHGGSYHGVDITQILTDFYQIRIANWYGGFYETDGCARILHLESGTYIRLWLTKDWEENLRPVRLSKWW
jgi:hypothetical protein